MNALAQKKSPTPLADPLVRNRLLAAVPPSELRALERQFEYVRLPLRRSLHEPGQAMRYVHFPTSGIVSLLHVDETGASANLAVLGCEGMVGLECLLGAETATNRAVVQAAGGAYRLRASDAEAAFAEGGGFHAVALRFARALIMELSQTAVCNLHHRVEQQLTRCLLHCLDRIEGDEIEMTHELIASLLGVRRQGVTEAAQKLQERKAIAYSRGRITVLDRGALEECACECYGAIKREKAALFATP